MVLVFHVLNSKNEVLVTSSTIGCDLKIRTGSKRNTQFLGEFGKLLSENFLVDPERLIKKWKD